MNLTTFARLKIARIECMRGTYAGRLTDYGDEKRAVRVVRAWGGPLFRGATFAVYREGAPASSHVYAEIAAMFDLPIGKVTLREPKPAVVRKPVRVIRPPRAKKTSPAPGPAPMRMPAPSTPTVGYFLPADQIAA